MWAVSKGEMVRSILDLLEAFFWGEAIEAIPGFAR
jgi:hypothetical protein